MLMNGLLQEIYLPKIQSSFNKVSYGLKSKNNEIDLHKLESVDLQEEKIIQTEVKPNNAPNRTHDHGDHIDVGATEHVYSKNFTCDKIEMPSQNGHSSGNYDITKIKETEEYRAKYPNLSTLIDQTFTEGGIPITQEEFEGKLEKESDQLDARILSFPLNPKTCRQNPYNHYHALKTRLGGAFVRACRKLMKQIQTEYVNRLKSAYSGIFREYILEDSTENQDVKAIKLLKVPEYIQQ